ncbi:hypothetical protein [Gimesia maris]|uniref:hypothetical protein n=1 Tax=Gimesia maris TaxID=122 RepID=UPI0030DCFD85|tara:strand:+ start:135014 stop:135436 length:423 start_codon:yes stop_codon:yes gene_type:complete
MALVTPNLGELELLDKMLKDALTTDEDYILKLFHTDVTPDQNSASSSFVEATFTNYAAVTLTRTNWNAAVVNGSNAAESSYGSSAQSWTCGATGDTVYGYWVEGATSGTCLWAEAFSTARTLTDSDVLNLTPKFSLQSAN